MIVKHADSAFSQVKTETYLIRHQFFAMVRMVIEHQADLAKLCDVDEMAIQSILIDYIRVSLRVDTSHALSEYLCEPSVDYEFFKDYFEEFIDALANPDYSQAFEQMVKAVNEFDASLLEAHQQTQPPNDPN